MKYEPTQVTLASSASVAIDYGYEEHMPSPKRESKPVVPSTPNLNKPPPLLDVTEVTESPSESISFEYECEERHQKRSFRRRGGELHNNLLKSAVMASMDMADLDDGPRRGSCQSFLSSASLQSGRSSPRKRVRRARPSDPDFEIEDTSLLLRTLTVSHDPPPRNPPIRRVSRKKSHDSRASDYGSDFSDWDDE